MSRSELNLKRREPLLGLRVIGGRDAFLAEGAVERTEANLVPSEA